MIYVFLVPVMVNSTGLWNVSLAERRPRKVKLSVWWRKFWRRLVIIDWSVSWRWMPYVLR